MSNEDPYPQILTPKQIEFEIKRGFQQVPSSVWRQMLVKDVGKAEGARDMAIFILAERFRSLQVRAPAPIGNMFADKVKAK